MLPNLQGAHSEFWHSLDQVQTSAFTGSLASKRTDAPRRWAPAATIESAVAAVDQSNRAQRLLPALRRCGYHALNSLRIEKAYRDWSRLTDRVRTPSATPRRSLGSSTFFGLVC